MMSMKTVVRIAPALKKIREKDLEIFRGKLPTAKELDSFAEMLKPLLMIKSVSDEFQADKIPTIHLALPLLCRIGAMSKSSKFGTSSQTTRAVVEAFEAGLEARIKDMGRQNKLFAFANYLHPTYKGALLNFGGNAVAYNMTVDNIKSLFPEVHPEIQSSQEQVSFGINCTYPLF